jgi:hypothetical protein
MVQRIGMSLGFALLSAVATARRAQHFADRAILLDVTAPHHHARIAQMLQHGPGGLLPLWGEAQARALTDGYNDAYFILGAATLLVIPLVLAGRWITPGTSQLDAPNLVGIGN